MSWFSKSFVLLPQSTKSPQGLGYALSTTSSTAACFVQCFLLLISVCLSTRVRIHSLSASFIIFCFLLDVSFLTHDVALVRSIEKDVHPPGKEAGIKQAMQRSPCQVQSSQVYMLRALNKSTSTQCTLQRTKDAAKKKDITHLKMCDEIKS